LSNFWREVDMQWVKILYNDDGSIG
jgi:hypothetical protein